MNFSITSYEKTWMNFLANPIVHSIGLAPCGPGCEFQTFTYFVIDPCQVPILTDLDFANVKRRGKFLPREFVQSSVGNHSMGCLALTNHPGIYYGVAQSRTRLNQLSSSSSSNYNKYLIQGGREHGLGRVSQNLLQRILQYWEEKW